MSMTSMQIFLVTTFILCTSSLDSGKIHLLSHNIPCTFTTRAASTKGNAINNTKATNTACFISGFMITILLLSDVLAH